MTTQQRKRESQRLADLERALAEAAEDAYEEARYGHKPLPQNRGKTAIERPARVMGQKVQGLRR